MGLLDASASSGGSISSAKGASESWSNTAGVQASVASAEQARLAHERQLELLEKTQEYNSKEAEKQREWEQKNIDIANNMANTVYSRSVSDMIKAGINPVLAASMGLSGAGAGSVTSGASASIGVPSTYMGNTFAEQNSASNSYNESNGSSWNQSESGLATFLESMGTWVSGMIGALNSAHTIEVSLKGLGLDTGSDSGQNGGDKGTIGNLVEETKETIRKIFGKGGYSQYSNGKYYTPYGGIFETMHQLGKKK